MNKKVKILNTMSAPTKLKSKKAMNMNEMLVKTAQKLVSKL